MARTYSNTGEAHRELMLDLTDPLLGDDVKALQREVNQRLRARGQEEYVTGGADGIYGPKTARACSRALWLMGCTDHTVEMSKMGNGGTVKIGAQRIIRHPGIRNDRQLATAKSRMARVERAEAAAAKSRAGIQVSTEAAELCWKHAPLVHYTQGPLRWQGILKQLIAAQGEYPNYADCSSFYSWCLWQILREGPDVVNGADWKGGYTGTLLAHGRRVDENHEGAAWIYGNGGTGKHVAYGIGGGMVISHGSEGGPYRLSGKYRGDLMVILAYV